MAEVVRGEGGRNSLEEWNLFP